MNVSELPKNCIFTHGAMSVNNPPPAGPATSHYPSRGAQGYCGCARRDSAHCIMLKIVLIDPHLHTSNQVRRGAYRFQIIYRVMAQLTEQQHPQKISAAPPERPLLQGLAVLHQKEHVKHKVQPCRSKVLSYYTPIPTLSIYNYYRLTIFSSPRTCLGLAWLP